jgi:amino acid adenylation domain-containing protein
MQSPSTGYDIAVVGVAGRFPGASNVAQFWRNLCAGVESVKCFTEEELLAAGESPELLKDPHYVKAQPVLDEFDRFDASFFGFSPQDAAVMDPQHRVFLEVGWEALEAAGHQSESFPGTIGVFATCGMNSYMMYHLIHNREVMDTFGEWLVRHTGNDMSFLATRLAYELNLKGPSLNVQTACSSALVAIHLACVSLLSGECDMALGGGATIILPQNRGYLYKPNEILSPDGHCRPFDARARGTVFGSGAGVVVLRRLADALADGDRILAVVKGSAINNDGSSKVGYLAPSVEGQSKAITEALTVSGVHPETISYNEAHGTATIVGDPIEVVALTEAYRHFTQKKGFCALGSVKSNIGHLGEVAGIAAFVKTVLALQNQIIPPSLHYESPNPQIDFANSPFFVNAKLVPWPASDGPRRAGITSLGAGGTNCHVIVEEPPAVPASGPSRSWQLLLLSTASASALETATENLGRHLVEHPDVSLADVAYTLHVGRKAMEHRRALVCRDRDEAVAACESREGIITSSARGADPKIAFLFPGQGAQYPNMGRGLYDSEPAFRAEVDQCLEILKREQGLDLRELLFPSAPAKQACERLSQTAVAQPALFVVEFALAKLWMSWGVKPWAMLGHSIGEYVAACLAGVFSLRDAITLVAERGRLMQQAPPGAMLAVALPADEIKSLLAHPGRWVELSLSVMNGPEQSVVGGPGGPMTALEAEFAARGIQCRRLETSHAFHSSMMDPVLASYGERVRRVALRPPTISYLSNLTGTWVRPEEATDPAYWVRHLRHTVRFSENLSTLLANTDQILLEVGPGRTLGGLARQQSVAPVAVVPSLGRPGEAMPDAEMLLRALGHLWVHGCNFDAARFYEGQRRSRVALPTYPFERQRFWVEADAPVATGPPVLPDPVKIGGKKSDLADWFYVPTWKRSRLPEVVPPPDAPRDWLVFLDECGLGADLIEQLRKPESAGANREAVHLEIADPGNIDSLTVRPDERRQPGPGEVEIRVCATALNFADVLKATGVFAEAPFGMECAGVIERVGPDVTEFHAGDEIVAIGPESFRSYLIRQARHVARKPAFLSMEEAVTLPAAFMTAWYALHHVGKLHKGEKVLIHAASGGVGLAAVQVARLAGAEIFATAGSEEKRAFLRSLGLRHVFDSRSHGFAEQILQRTRGTGVNAVLNSLTGEFIPKSFSLLAAGGRFLELGKREIYSEAQLAVLALPPGVSYFPIDLTKMLSHEPEAYGCLLREVIEQANQRRFEALPRQVFAFSAAVGAFRLMLQTRHIGKVVLTMAPAAPEVYTVRAGTRFKQLNQRDFVLEPGSAAQYVALLEALERGKAQVGRVVHLWNVTPHAAGKRHHLPILKNDATLEKTLERGFFSLTWLAKAVASRDWTHPISLAVISTGLHQIAGETACQPAKATLHGPCRVIPRELPNLTCRSIDVPASSRGNWQRARLVQQLVAELTGDSREPVVAYRNTDRWVQQCEPAPLRPSGGNVPLRRGGVYLITGGLGDLGLGLAEHLAKTAQANLVLIGRSSLPPRDDWEQWLLSHEQQDRISEIIRRVRACEAVGGKVLLATADVTDRKRLHAVVALTRKQFGAIHGVIHAAGTLDDGLIQLKTPESALGVLASKVKGTLVLDRVLGGEPLDFFVLFSSISSLLGLQGQVDYTAANAFLDGFASSRSARCAGQTVAVNWSAWQEVGMAAKTVRRLRGQCRNTAAGHPTRHPWLDSRHEDAGNAVFVTSFSRARQWLLGEHALRGGEALIPGTGFLELARAALVEVVEAPVVEISGVVFQVPFAVANGETRELTLTLRPAGDKWDFDITSHCGSVTHVTGHLARATTTAPKRIDIAALSASCNTRSDVLNGYLPQSFMDFGPRWGNVRRIDFGRDAALLTLELPLAFASDLDPFLLHPALLDMATGGAQPLLPGFDSSKDFYVPFSYGRLVLWKGLSRRLYSHVRLRDAKGQGLAVFDVTLADEDGTVLAEVSDFIMKRVSHLPTETAHLGSADASSKVSAASLASEMLRQGIAPAEGIEAFNRILACGVAPQVIVSPVDPRHWITQADALAERSRAAAVKSAAPAGDTLASAATSWNGAPRGDQIELGLQKLYSQMLGVQSVGLHDDFFDLGGQSLLAIRLVSRVRDIFQVELPLPELFEAPTIAALAKRIAAALADRQKLQAPPLVPVARDGDVVLSFAQERLQFLDQLEPHKSVYNLPFAVRLTGPVDVLVLERDLTEIVRRHEVLRTTFHADEDRSVQRIGPAVPLKLQIVDFDHLPEAERESAAQQWLSAEAGRPFDLTQDLMLRASLLRLGAQEHVLLLTMHHIASDGWSMGILSQELSVLYKAFLGGQPSPLAELPFQYGDYAVWQRQWLQHGVLEQQLAYWKKRLAGAPPLLELPTDHPRPALQSYRGCEQVLVIEKDLRQALEELSQREGATLFMTLLAAFQVLLSRYSGQKDIVVGSPIAGRNRTELEGLIGFFVNTLALWTDLSGNPPFRELLRRVRETTLGAYAHQDLPFEKLVEELQPKRTLSHAPLFQVMFVLHNAAPVPPEVPRLTVTPIAVANGTAKFDLMLSLVEEGEGLHGTLEYSTDLFESQTMARLLGHYRLLLEGIVADPGRRVEDLPLLMQTEQQQLLKWNDTESDLPQDGCLHEVFAAQAVKTPHAIAAMFEGRQLTYDQLNRQADGLAHRLQAMGAGPDVSVGILVNRSLEMVIAVLGVLKAGSACLPLDRMHPKPRLQYMVENARAAILLTQSSQVDRLPTCNIPVCCLDDPEGGISECSSTNPGVRGACPENLAYVLYTSGSTGRPKGVAMSHGSLVNLVTWEGRRASSRPAARTLQFASLGFDVSFQEIFTTWSSGGMLVVASDELRHDLASLWRMIHREQIERLFLPVVVLQQLAEQAERQALWPRALREVITAGEPLRITPPIRRLFRKLKDCQLVNQYGPTEAHVVTSFSLTGQADTWSDLPPIGRPIDNVHIYILDGNQRPVPIGVAGELHIGGKCLARGYINAPELTSERFVPSAFAKDSGARLYKTGDLARYRADGNIEFIGRADNQVKIRGFRIELGEVESVLSQHPSIAQCAVTTVESKGDQRLVAYVVGHDSNSDKGSEWRRHLSQFLPEYMVPSLFVPMTNLPVNANGKIDRQALVEAAPLLKSIPVGCEISTGQPRNGVEARLVEIWQDLLNVRGIGRQDNFFEVGGHSLLAVRLIAQIEKEFQKVIPLAQLFQAPTIECLAATLRGTEAPKRKEFSVIVPFNEHGEGLPLYFVHSVGGEVASFRHLARLLGPEQPFYGIQAPPDMQSAEFASSIESMARYYVEAIMAFQADAPCLLGGWSAGSTIALEMAQQMTALGRPVELLIALDGAPYNTNSGTSLCNPMYYWKLLRNFPDWVANDLMLDFSFRVAARRVRNKVLAFSESVAGALRGRGECLQQVNGFMDLSNYSPSHVAFMNALNRALRAYIPKPYPGRVLLYKSRTQPLYHLLEAERAWPKIARHVEVVVVRGTHITVVREPYIRIVAEDFQKRLSTLQAQNVQVQAL